MLHYNADRHLPIKWPALLKGQICYYLNILLLVT